VGPDRLAAYDLALKDVFDAISKKQCHAQRQFIEHQSEQWVVRGLGLVQTSDDIGNIVLAVHNGTPIRVHDVAEVATVRIAAGRGDHERQGRGRRGIVLMLREPAAARSSMR